MSARSLRPEPTISAASVLQDNSRSGEAVDTLARTLWSDARGEPVRAMEALAALVMNRVRRARERGGWWWGGDVVAVCRKPGQFGGWNGGRDAVTSDDPAFAACRRIARRAVAGQLADPTFGATHVHRAGESPDWAHGRSACAEFGTLLFYNDVE
ncbi:cell wall hydrolase [Azospirillum rugosum]|uniref:Spore germination cell wall hydrolase CwlJ-like protein n=1 Tax=Azospirillum rugosum TaxID=416170 RepID=A0ABS4SKJ6_9PROT|nr:cell wall hydrolase [Azospirillum rugosum]MBP2293084.1 spore germination cell wall hydrolase CwlJ-like protein [Azospirillum rugosum]MDQ0526633.1 spore germination cell wall hydrolase CwlJ-like protein [Azospirillum rugosum]